MSIQRDVSVVHDETRPDMAPPTLPDPTPHARAEAVMDTEVVTAVPVTAVPVTAVPVTAVPVTAVPVHEVVQTQSSMTISPAAIVAGAASIVLLLFGAINLARAGVDGPMRDPVVEVAGYQGTAVLGLIVLGAGLALLAASFSRDRGAILFVSIVLGVAAATVAIEPTVGGDLVAVERDFGIAVLIVAVFVAFVAVVAPSVRRTSNRLERA
jgi:hypothetical protein